MLKLEFSSSPRNRITPQLFDLEAGVGLDYLRRRGDVYWYREG